MAQEVGILAFPGACHMDMVAWLVAHTGSSFPNHSVKEEPCNFVVVALEVVERAA